MSVGAPTVIHVGKQKRKVREALRAGDPEVLGAVRADLRARGELAEGATPLIFVVERRPKARLRLLRAD